MWQQMQRFGVGGLNVRQPKSPERVTRLRVLSAFSNILFLYLSISTSDIAPAPVKTVAKIGRQFGLLGSAFAQDPNVPVSKWEEANAPQKRQVPPRPTHHPLAATKTQGSPPLQSIAPLSQVVEKLQTMDILAQLMKSLHTIPEGPLNQKPTVGRKPTSAETQQQLGPLVGRSPLAAASEQPYRISPFQEATSVPQMFPANTQKNSGPPKLDVPLPPNEGKPGALQKLSEILYKVLNRIKPTIESPSAQAEIFNSSKEPFTSEAHPTWSSATVKLDGTSAVPASAAAAAISGSAGRARSKPFWMRPGSITKLHGKALSMSLPPTNSDVCPSVGGLSHPFGNSVYDLADWSMLLCRSHGILQNAQQTDTQGSVSLILLRGFKGIYDSDDKTTTTEPHKQHSAGTSSQDQEQLAGDKLGGEPFSKSKTQNQTASEQQSGTTSIEAGAIEGVKKTPLMIKSDLFMPRKSDELEEDTKAVIDLLSMLHCRVASVLDVQHPANKQFYESVYRAAVARAQVLQRKEKLKKALHPESVLSEKDHNSRNKSTEENYHVLEESSLRQDNYQHKENAEPRVKTADLGGTTDDEFLAALFASDATKALGAPEEEAGNDTIGGKEQEIYQQNESAEPRLETKHLAGTTDDEELAALFANDATKAVGTIDLKERQDKETISGAGPVLKVMRGLGMSEKLYFGYNEIRDYLLDRVADTACRIRAYRILKKRSEKQAKKPQAVGRKTAGQTTMETSLSTSSIAAERPDPFAFMSSSSSAVGVSFTNEDETRNDKRPQKRGVAKLSAKEWFYGWKRQQREEKKVDKTEELLKFPIVESTETHSTPQSQRNEQRGPVLTATASSPENPIEVGDNGPWWISLRLRFDLYVASLDPLNNDGLTETATDELMQKIKQWPYTKLVCVYEYYNPRTNVPPVVHNAGRLPVLLLGQHFTTGARSIMRLLTSIAEFEPSTPFSLEHYAALLPEGLLASENDDETKIEDVFALEKRQKQMIEVPIASARSSSVTAMEAREQEKTAGYAGQEKETGSVQRPETWYTGITMSTQESPLIHGSALQRAQ